MHFYEDALFRVPLKKLTADSEKMAKDRNHGSASFQKLREEDFVRETVAQTRELYKAFKDQTWACISSSAITLKNPIIAQTEIENLAFFVTDLSFLLVSFASEKDKEINRTKEVAIYRRLRQTGLSNPPVSKEAALTTIESIQLYSQAASKGEASVRSMAEVFGRRIGDASLELQQILETQISKFFDSNGSDLSTMVRGFVYR